MQGDSRSFRVAVMADRYVNPPAGGPDGLRVALEEGWGVLQLPDDGYPPEVIGPIVAEVAEHVEEFSRRGYDVVLVGEGGDLADALDRLEAPRPEVVVPSDEAELRSFLSRRPPPPAASLLS